MSTDIFKLESQCEKNFANLSSKNMEIMNIYHYLIEEISDPRVSDWLFMSNPLSIALISLAYLSFVLYFGPRYMKNRKPYALKKTMICYNISVAIANLVIFYGMARWVWWILILKITELADTVIFILRKKYNQTSFLHIYHHTITLFLAWISCKYAPGGMWTFIMLPNCAVHVIMYMYYFCACLGPEMQNIVTPWKKYMTRLQLYSRFMRAYEKAFCVICSYMRTSLWLQRFP
ncbi:very long chain fatty acid elongase 7 isoform X2 [Anoplolepis gracilipes]|uniref:very long chain fatty acid elongase 7 isoform X2 n=1 Tax=Anoplolepis gracilipes TaxID=354296 RepID=UPI003BA3B49D